MPVNGNPETVREVLEPVVVLSTLAEPTPVVPTNSQYSETFVPEVQLNVAEEPERPVPLAGEDITALRPIV